MTVIYSESTFPRANRDDCTRAADPLQGPYEQSYRLADAVIAALLVGVIAAIVFRVLP